MQAIVVHRPGGPEVLELATVDEPRASAGQLLVDVAAIGVNFKDVYEREGRPPYRTSTPFVPGSEGAGVVAAIGDGVSDFRFGDRVAWAGASASYAERVIVPATAAVRVPADITLEVAAASMLQGLTAHYLSVSAYPVAAGDHVLVHAAAGGVGLLLTQMVKLRGGLVLATTSTGEKAALAKHVGADEAVSYEGFSVAARAWSGGSGVAVVYDGIGRDTFDESLASLRPRGYLVLYGSASGVVPPFDLLRLLPGSQFVTRPVLGAYLATRSELEARTADLFGWISTGRVTVRIGAVYPLSEAALAHEALESRKTAGKVLLTPEA